jgi:hypothetical protein
LAIFVTGVQAWTSDVVKIIRGPDDFASEGRRRSERRTGERVLV